ncbi:MAG: hypothetical protein DRP56_01695, partial [Planctomycetota bacterium]
LDSDRVKPSQWNLLRIGVYELVYAPKTADYAILNEAVQLARQAGSKKGAGFINAVLRNVQRAIEDRQTTPEAKRIRRMVPQTPESGCLFNDAIMPDPDTEAVQYFSVAFSIPQPLIAEWLKTFGKEKTRAICFASNRSPSVIAQPNTLHTTTVDWIDQLGDEDIAIEQRADEFRIRRGGKINTSRRWREGLFFIQDTTAANAIKTLSPTPDWTVLDVCAAPGGKCMASAVRMRDKGVILASDADAERLKKVRENAQRMRLQSIEIVPPSRLEQTVQKLKRLDAIVLDVPCSNTGVLARRVEARWRWTPEAVANLRRTQQQLLHQAAALAHRKTKILYSTCSIQPEENGEQIQAFLTQHNRFTLLTEKLTLPALQSPDAFDHDGGYAAVLQSL